MKRTLMMGTVGLLLGALVAFLLLHGFRLGSSLSRSAPPTGSPAAGDFRPMMASAEGADGVMEEAPMAPPAAAPMPVASEALDSGG
ncbi:hypothetical protein ACLESD_53640, partial [Pyxidicoccus sp. 3LFB2]